MFGSKGQVDVGLFTHPHSGTWESIPGSIFQLDHIVHMSQKYVGMFIDHGIPAEKMTHLTVPVEQEKFPLKKICLGYSGRMGSMKGPGVLRDLISNYDLSCFRFKWVGPNLQEFHDLCISMNIESKLVNASYENYPREYEEFDYLLIPSLAEGGPMCILEAIAMGIPVISSDVGIAREIPVDYIYEPGDTKALYQILSGLTKERLDRRARIKDLTWENFTLQLGEVFRKVLHQKGYFSFRGKLLNYFNAEKERTIELPIALEFLGSTKSSVLEVGDVLSNYGYSFGQDVVDKYSKDPGILALDIVEYSPGKKYDKIVSISTLEHVGFDSGEQREPGKLLKALLNLRAMLNPGGSLLVTMPLNFNPDIEESFSQFSYSSLCFLMRDALGWRECTYEEAKQVPYDASIGAGSIVVGFIG